MPERFVSFPPALLPAGEGGFFGRLASRVTLLGLVCIVFSLRQAWAEPDISAVWMAFASDPPAVRLGPAQAKLTPAGEALVARFEETYGQDYPDPGAFCVPQGMPSVMLSMVTYPVEIIQHPKRITMLAELEMQVRRIYLDGRGHPDDYPTTRVGHSIGRWEGETLVIDTALLTGWETRNWPHTENTRIVERLHLTTRDKIKAQPAPFITIKPLDDQVLVVDLTLTDPEIYAEPVKITMYYQKVSDDNTLEYDCPVDLWLDALEEQKK